MTTTIIHCDRCGKEEPDYPPPDHKRSWTRMSWGKGLKAALCLDCYVEFINFLKARRVPS